MPPTTTPKHNCTYSGCQFTFSKRNHLERHWKTLTQSQEFDCPTCKRRFSRLDSRNRHIQRLHSGFDSSSNQRRQSGTRGSTSIQGPSEQSQPNDDEDRDDDDEMDDVRGEERVGNNTSEPIFSVQSADFVSHGPDEAAYYGAAEQLSRLRHQPSLSGESNQQTHQSFFDGSSNETALTMRSTMGATSAAYVLFDSINATSPSNASMENNESLLDDFDPMMCSLLWRTLEASITEASGPSYVNTSSRTIADHSAMFDLLTWQGRSPISMPTHASVDQLDNVENTLQAGADTTLRRNIITPSSGNSRRATIIPADHQYDATSSAVLGPEAAQMAAQMKSDLHNLMGHIEAPIEPEKGLASSCLWLCRRHFLLSNVLTAPQRMSKVHDDGYALVINLIAIGSLWHHNPVARKWGFDIWSFTLRVVWSRGMRNVQDDTTVSMLMSILLSGHSYVLMSSDPAVHKLGRRAWLFCHLLHDNCHHSSKKSVVAGDILSSNPSVEEDLEFHLNQDKYRAELRNNSALLYHTWQKWKELEGSVRIAWGICLYDSQQAAWLDMIPSLQADVSRRYQEPASEKLLEAKTAQEWLSRYELETPERRDLASVMKLLHRPFPCSSEKITWSSSQQAHYNIIESIYSSWLLDKAILGKTSEYWNIVAQRLPQSLGLLRSTHALANWRLFWHVESRNTKQEDTHCLLIRWHCVHLNFGVDDVDMVQYLREQTRHLARKDEATEALQIPRKHSRCSAEEFYLSPRGRRTLWHAGRICTELSRLPRVTCTPLHVAQAAYESTLLRIVFALIEKQRQDTRQGKAFELLELQNDVGDDDNWNQLGLAGFMTSDMEAYTIDDSAHADWGNLSGSAARRWIVEGETQDTTISGLSLHQCSMALQDVNRALEQSRLLWCLAADYQNLISRGLSLLS